MAERNVNLSVVIISWNQCSLLQNLVEQLLDQDFPAGQYEIIIVDDGSTDGTREWLHTLDHPHVRTVFGEVNYGRAASRNVGIQAARNDVVVMIDGDHTLRRDFLLRHAERHTCEICAIVGKSQFADRPDCHALNIYLNEGGASKLRPDSRLPGRYFLTRNCSVPREVLNSIGGFDERFSLWGGEDLDLGVCLEEAGVPTYGEPRAIAVHHHWRKLSPLLDNMQSYGRGAVPLLLQKHPQLFAELNLDHVFTWNGRSRYSAFHRWFVRNLLRRPVFAAAIFVANLFMRFRLPRLIFDYLHFRAYAAGFAEHVSNGKDTSFGR